MSQIASFHLISLDSVPALREAAVVRRTGLLRKRKDTFWEALQQLAQSRVDFDSGYAVIVLLEFLREERGFDFAGIEDHSLAEYLARVRGTSFEVFEAESAAAFALQLAGANLTLPELVAFENDFCDTTGDEAGQAMQDAAETLHKTLALVIPGTIGVLYVA